MVWLSTSLFCNKGNWHRLLSESFVTLVANIGGIAAYEITFNYLSGENIRLGLLTEEANAYTLAKTADEHFKAFFENAELPIGELKLPVKGIFMPFPVNSIQYGLYLPQQQAEQYSSLSIGLSQIIVNVLKDDVIDDETILTFAFYLQVSLIKTIGKDRIGFTETLSPMAGNYNNSLSNVNREKFAENRDTLIEIAMDILHDRADNPQWLKEWITLCGKEMNKMPHTNPIIIYKELVRLVHKRLGIGDNMRLMLSEFISGCFAKVTY